jgi:O-succinylbenzoate synthase
MALTVLLSKKTFHFSFDARTSRGAMKEKVSWFIKIYDTSAPEVYGLGECSPLPGLSPEHSPELNDYLETIISQFNSKGFTPPNTLDLKEIKAYILNSLSNDILKYPSIVFAFETALLDFMHGGNRLLFKNTFAKGVPIPINGLIWMGGLDFMLQQIEIKIRDGFRCIKLKVGGIDFEKECDVLQYIRRKYFRENITIRLDANGAFKPAEAIYKLNELARFDVHSIEQPIKPGLPEMEDICRTSPIPIALDEELIGIEDIESKAQLLRRISPSFIILKPTLHGGLYACRDWIQLAEKQNIKWWVTSALESNVGLNAIAQFTAEHPISLPQGLGTGMIYSDNIESPLIVRHGNLSYEDNLSWAMI